MENQRDLVEVVQHAEASLVHQRLNPLSSASTTLEPHDRAKTEKATLRGH